MPYTLRARVAARSEPRSEDSSASHGGSPSRERYAGVVSPRHVPATTHELARCALLASLPGEKLAALAQQMERRDVAAGSAPVLENEDGDRSYVVLGGLFAVSATATGARGVLRPGDHFGGVATDVPRTASVRAITPGVVASCDRSTFDELVRPLLTGERPSA
jgi:CRP-like cAMP-binding protein